MPEGVAVVGAAIALLLTPVAPPGIPIIASGLAVLAGWRTGQESGR